MSTREDILARINVVIDNIDGTLGLTQAGRNQDDLSGRSRPAVILHDGDENLRENNNTPKNMRGSGPGILVDFMDMRPRLELLINEKTIDVGTKLNEYRDKILPAIVMDTTLANLVGQNGEIRYLGLSTETSAGEKREGRITLNFSLLYTLDIAAL